jgi:hypothetical protein
MPVKRRRNGARNDRENEGGGALPGRELLVLQLCHRGYTPEHMSHLLQCSVDAVEGLLASAATRLGCGTDWRAAAAIARQRGLIV